MALRVGIGLGLGQFASDGQADFSSVLNVTRLKHDTSYNAPVWKEIEGLRKDGLSYQDIWFQTIGNGNLNIVRAFIENPPEGFDVNLKNPIGMTGLHLAARTASFTSDGKLDFSNTLSMVKMLVEEGKLDIAQLEDTGLSAYAIAAEMDHVPELKEVASYLKEKLNKAAEKAVKEKDQDRLDKLIKAGANDTYVIEGGEQPENDGPRDVVAEYKEKGFALAKEDDPLPSLGDTRNIGFVSGTDKKYIRYELKDGNKKFIAKKGSEHYDEGLNTLRALAPSQEGDKIPVYQSQYDIDLKPEMISNIRAPKGVTEGALIFDLKDHDELADGTYIIYDHVTPYGFAVVDRIHRRADAEMPEEIGESETETEESDELPEFEGFDDANVLGVDVEVSGSDETMPLGEGIMYSLVKKYSEDGSLDDDDPRKEFVKLFRAMSALNGGQDITPFVEDVRWEGAHTSRSDGKPKNLNSADWADLLDGEKVQERFNELFARDDIQADYDDIVETLLEQVPDLDQRRENLQEIIDDPSEYAQWLAELKLEDPEGAEKHFAMIIGNIGMLFEDQTAEAFASDVSLLGISAAVDKTLRDPGSIESKYYTQSAEQIVTGLLTTARAAASIPRRVVESLEALFAKTPEKLGEFVKNLQMIIAESDAASLTKATLADGGQIQEGYVKTALQKTLADAQDKAWASQFRQSITELNKGGFLGTTAGLIALGSGILKAAAYKSSATGRDGAITGHDYGLMSLAKDILLSGSFFGAYVKTFDTLTAFTKIPGLGAVLGLDKSLPEIWGKKGALRSLDKSSQYYTLANAAGHSSLESTLPIEVDDNYKDFSTRWRERASTYGIKGVDIARFAAGSALRVLGSVADIGVGVLDIVLGIIGLRGQIITGTDVAFGLQVASGIFSIGAGLAGTAGHFGVAGAARMVPFLFAPAALLGFGSFVAGIAKGDQNERYDNQKNYFESLAEGGYLQADWGDKLEYAMYSLYYYNGRGTPDDISIFDYQWREYENFLNTPGKKGSSENRLDEDLRFDNDYEDWTPN